MGEVVVEGLEPEDERRRVAVEPEILEHAAKAQKTRRESAAGQRDPPDRAAIGHPAEDVPPGHGASMPNRAGVVVRRVLITMSVTITPAMASGRCYRAGPAIEIEFAVSTL